MPEIGSGIPSDHFGRMGQIAPRDISGILHDFLQLATTLQ